MNTTDLVAVASGLTTATTTRVLSGLLDVSLRGSLLILIAWAATRVLHRGSAALRHLIWASALGGMLLIPLLGAVIPSVRISVLPTLPTLPTLATTPSSAANHTSANVAPATSSMPTMTAREIEPTGAPSRQNTRAATSPAPSPSITQMLPLLWAIGAVLLLLRLAVGMIRVSVWTRRARSIDDGGWLTLANRLASELRITRPITLLRSDRACVPMTWGVVYPTVLIPADADEWTTERRTIVLLHELAHVKRLDALTQMVVQIAVSAFWFNPLVWLAARHMRTEREHACDDFVLQGGARASDYAQDLLQIARSLGDASAPAAAALAMARRSEIEGRLLAILDPKTNRRNVSRSRLVVASAGVLALALPLAALAPAVRAATTDTGGAQTARAPEAVRDRHVDPIAPTAPPNPLRDLTDRDVDRTAAPDAPDAPAYTMPAATYAAPSDTFRVRVPAITVVVPERKQDAIPRAQQATHDLETLISVARAAKRLTTDSEKAELLIMIAEHYVRDDELRTAYLDAVATMTSDYERNRALTPLLLKDSLPMSAVAQVVKVVSSMTSDLTKATLIITVTSDHPGLTPPIRAALIATTGSFTSDHDRGRAIRAIAGTDGLSTSDVAGLLAATLPMTSDYEKANTLIAVARRYPLEDASVRKAYFRAAETMTSSYDYRRAVSAVLK